MGSNTDVKQRLTLVFNQRGQAQTERAAAQVDRAVVKAGASGTKALGGMAKAGKDAAEGTMKLTGALGAALGPAKGVAEGVEKLVAAVGSGNPLMAVATVAVGALASAYLALKDSSKEAAKAIEEAAAAAVREQRIAGAEGNARKVLGELLRLKVTDLALTDDAIQLSREATKAEEEAIAAGVNRAALEAMAAEQAKEASAAENRLRDARARLEDAWTAEDIKASAAAVRAEEAAVAALTAKVDQLSDGAAELAFRHEDLADAALKSAAAYREFMDALGPPKDDKGPAAASAAVRALSDDLRDFTDREAAMARAAEQFRAARVRDVDAEWTAIFAALSSEARVRQQFREADAEGAEKAAALQRQIDSGEWLDGQIRGYEQAKSVAQAYGEQLAATAAATAVIAALEGESIREALGAFLKAKRDEAIIESLTAGAKALGAGATAFLTGSPSAAAAATQYGLEAAAWGAVAVATGLGAAAAGTTPKATGAGSGGGSRGLTGQQGQAGPVSVYVNFAGPTTGLGRYLAAELNAEATRQGGARLDTRIVRR